MIALRPLDRLALRTNDIARRAAQIQDRLEPDPAPVVKLFAPTGSATWLATELARDGDTLFGLADLGFGYPELGYFSLGELGRVVLPYGLRVECDLGFATRQPLSLWARAARHFGSILHAQAVFARRFPLDTLPPRPDPHGSEPSC